MEKAIGVCGTVTPNHGLPRDMIQEAQQLKKGEVTFHRKRDVLLLSFRDKRVINMICTLHTAQITDAPSRRSGKTKMKSKCVID
jgi:hypothetical protein